MEVVKRKSSVVGNVFNVLFSLFCLVVIVNVADNLLFKEGVKKRKIENHILKLENKKIYTHSKYGFAIYANFGRPRVKEINYNSIAYRSGLRVGDVIYSADGDEVWYPFQISAYLEKSSTDRIVKLRVKRSNVLVDIALADFKEAPFQKPDLDYENDVEDCIINPSRQCLAKLVNESYSNANDSVFNHAKYAELFSVLNEQVMFENAITTLKKKMYESPNEYEAWNYVELTQENNIPLDDDFEDKILKGIDLSDARKMFMYAYYLSFTNNLKLNMNKYLEPIFRHVKKCDCSNAYLYGYLGASLVNVKRIDAIKYVYSTKKMCSEVIVNLLIGALEQAFKNDDVNMIEGLEKIVFDVNRSMNYVDYYSFASLYDKVNSSNAIKLREEMMQVVENDDDVNEKGRFYLVRSTVSKGLLKAFNMIDQTSSNAYMLNIALVSEATENNSNLDRSFFRNKNVLEALSSTFEVVRSKRANGENYDNADLINFYKIILLYSDINKMDIVSSLADVYGRSSYHYRGVAQFLLGYGDVRLGYYFNNSILDNSILYPALLKSLGAKSLDFVSSYKEKNKSNNLSVGSFRVAYDSGDYNNALILYRSMSKEDKLKIAVSQVDVFSRCKSCQN